MTHRDNAVKLLCIPMLLVAMFTSGDGVAMIALRRCAMGRWLTGDDPRKLDPGGSVMNDIIGMDVFFEIIDPPELEYTYRLRPAKDFGAPFNASFSERNIALVPVQPATGCRQPTNADQLEGRVALVQRGECSFLEKSAVAEEAGAKAIIVADFHPFDMEGARSTPLWADHYYVEMIRDESGSTSKSVNIPAGFLLGKNGKMIRDTLERLNLPFALINIPVNLTFTPLSKLHQPPWLSW